MADYGHDLQFGFFLDPSTGNPDRTVEIAHILDELGFDLIGIQDHPYQQRHFDALALIGYILGQTERIRVFQDVGNLPLRPPVMLAKQIPDQCHRVVVLLLVRVILDADQVVAQVAEDVGDL